jgi:uncharacterized protein with von Willebrand factor type A (vWA) domain
VRARFSRWDGSQDPLGADLDLGRILDELSDDLLSGLGGDSALRDLQRRGLPDHFTGLDSLLERLRQRRRELSEQLNLSGPLDAARAELDAIIALERAEVASDPGTEARSKEMFLDVLPANAADAIRELSRYDFSSDEAAARFASLVEDLRREVLQSYFSNLAGALQNMSPEYLGRLKDMLAELNEMIARRERGEPYDFDGFMARYGDFFPDNPSTLDQLLDAMARRMTAMSRMLAGLTPEQRAELARLAEAVLGDVDLDFQVSQLAQSLRDLAPNLPWDAPAQGWNEGSGPLSATVDLIERMSEYDELESTLAGDYAGAELSDVDEDKLRRTLGDDAVRDLRRLKAIERALQDSGVVRRARGRLELTARGAKLLGERSLTRLLSAVAREPTHRARGGQAEPTGQTRQWHFGDAEPISVQRTVYNAVARSGPGERVSLLAEDFEVTETETRPQTATALLLDLSFSMPLGGHWVPAKRMVLALNALIEGKYPQDSLYLVGFSDYAREIKPSELASAGWEQVHGTNMQHAFMLARRLLGEDPSPVRQVIMVTDGEPTAHLGEDGGALFHWPPVRATGEKTLREAMRLARSGISINVFMLERSPGLVRFMDKLARATGGQVIPAHSRDLESTIVGDYVRRRRLGRG